MWRVAIMAIVLVSCAAPATPRPSPSDEAASPVRGGRIIEGAFAEPKTFAPWLANDASSLTVSALVYDGLYRIDSATGEIKPNLGRWNVSADGLTYRWNIEPGAIWSDGRPVIADDYVTAVRAVAKSRKSARVANFQDIEGFDEYRAGKAMSISGI